MAVLIIFACCACRSGASGGTTASLPSTILGSDVAAGASEGITTLSMPGGASGIGFDDLIFAPSIHRVLAPAGGTGNLDLIDPTTFQVTVIGGFSSSHGVYGGGHALPGAKSATMAFVAIAPSGHPTLLGTVPTAEGAHCVAADDRRSAWVCDPDHGQLLVFNDPYPATGS
jgi:hypothetical protein